MKRAYFTTCAECGAEEPNHNGVCNACAPLYADQSGTGGDFDPSDPVHAENPLTSTPEGEI